MTDSRSIRRLGVFSQVHGITGQEVSEVYARLLDAIVAADELGVDVFWVGQHHVDNSSGRLPSPLPLLAMAAERTKRVRLGVAVVVLPLEDPLRLAEDLAVVDVLSGGRLEVGLGTGGGDPAAFAAFGVPGEAGARRRIFDQKVARLQSILAGDSLTGEAGGPALVPARSELQSRIWQAVGTAERGRVAAKLGHGLLTGTFSDTQEEMLEKILAYREEWQQHHPGLEPRISAGRFVYTGRSRKAIEQEAAAGLSRFQHGSLAQRSPNLASLGAEDYLRRVARYGTTDEVIADLQNDRAILGAATDFHAILSLFPAAGDVTPGADIEIGRIEELVTTIAPELGWKPSAEPALI